MISTPHRAHILDTYPAMDDAREAFAEAFHDWCANGGSAVAATLEIVVTAALLRAAAVRAGLVMGERSGLAAGIVENPALNGARTVLVAAFSAWCTDGADAMAAAWEIDTAVSILREASARARQREAPDA